MYYAVIFLVAQMVKSLPAIQVDLGPGVQFLGQEGPLEKDSTTNSSILA